ncbi:MAG: putative addiction module antidote protein [Gammaproteobacteria bacterium]|nr:MAG: putative addiction module antidote protein [Gammaproteobacteria bacterium]
MSNAKTSLWDASEHLDTPEAINEYLTAALEEGDTDLLIAALGDIARAKGMTQLAKKTGLGRESLYKALTPGAKPRFDTIMRVMRGLGIHLAAQ